MILFFIGYSVFLKPGHFFSANLVNQRPPPYCDQRLPFEVANRYFLCKFTLLKRPLEMPDLMRNERRIVREKGNAIYILKLNSISSITIISVSFLFTLSSPFCSSLCAFFHFLTYMLIRSN